MNNFISLSESAIKIIPVSISNLYPKYHIPNIHAQHTIFRPLDKKQVGENNLLADQELRFIYERLIIINVTIRI